METKERIGKNVTFITSTLTVLGLLMLTECCLDICDETQ